MSVRDARSLFAAAREDGPDDAERDLMFREIAIATGIATATAAAAGAAASAGSATTAAGAATSAATEVAASAGKATTSLAAKAGGMFGIKLLAVGAALGAAGTALGVLLTLTLVAPESSRSPGRLASTTAPATVSAGARLAQPGTRKRDPADGAKNEVKEGADTTAPSGPSSMNAVNADLGAGTASDLGEEARLVTAARDALVAGDAARALALVQGARKLSARSLEPEELGLEARALRALGRADDAAATELVLRRRYPDHALAR